MKTSLRIALLLSLVLVVSALSPVAQALAQSTPREATFVMIGPSGVILDRTPTFEWKRIKEQPAYEVRLTQSKEVFVRPVTCETTYCAYTSPVTLGYKDYYWQVRLAPSGTWSSPMRFVISSPGFTTNFTWTLGGFVRYKYVGGLWDAAATYAWTDGAPGAWSPLYHKLNGGKYIDFDYTITIKRWSGNTSTSFPSNCLMARMGTYVNLKYYWYPGYRFCISNDGKYEIWYRGMSTADSHAIQRWTAHSAIRKGSSWNKLRVVAQGPNFQFYINDTPVKTFSDDSKDRGFVGVMMYRYKGTETELNIDYAKLTVIQTVGAVKSIFEPAPRLPYSEEEVIGSR